MTKIGRPTNNPKIAKVQAKLDEDTYAILISYCDNETVSISEGIRQAIRLLPIDDETIQKGRVD